MRQNFRNLYCGETAYPDIYIAAKLYVISSRLLNAILQSREVHEDTFKTLLFYAELAKNRAGITQGEIDEVYKSRDTVYNNPYNCRANLTEADLASFLVAKSLRMKNILAQASKWHRDSVLDFIVYLSMLKDLFNIQGYDSRKDF